MFLSQESDVSESLGEGCQEMLCVLLQDTGFAVHTVNRSVESCEHALGFSLRIRVASTELNGALMHRFLLLREGFLMRRHGKKVRPLVQ